MITPNIIKELDKGVQEFEPRPDEPAERRKPMEEKIMDAIGVVFTGSDSDGGLWARIDADGNVVPDPGQAFFDTHPVWGGMQDVAVDGQYVVKIPKFYIRRAQRLRRVRVRPLERLSLVRDPVALPGGECHHGQSEQDRSRPRGSLGQRGR